MTATRIIATLIFVTVLAGTFALSKPGDLAILQRISQTTVQQVRGGLPSNLAGPLASFHAGDALPVAERVRVRINSDKDLAGVEVRVSAMAGQIKLKGVVASVGQKNRAVELAERTAGVESVIDEMAIPER